MLRSVFSLFALIQKRIDKIRNLLKLKAENIQYAEKPIINGKIIIKNKGSIRLGKKNLFNCAPTSNLVGLPHPVILYTQNKNAEIIIGDNVGISGTSIVAKTKIKIGNNVSVGGGCGIWDTDFHPLSIEARKEHSTRDAVSKPITIEDDVFIGARAIILKGVTIGRGAIVGAGAVINRDVPAGAMAFGNPMIIKNKIK